MDECDINCFNYPYVLKCKTDNNLTTSQLYVCPKDSKLPLPDEMQPQRILHSLFGIISNELISGEESTEYIDIGYTWKISFILKRIITVFLKLLQLYEEELSDETLSYKINEKNVTHDFKKKNLEATEKSLTSRSVLMALSIKSQPSPVSSLLTSTGSGKLGNKRLSMISTDEDCLITSSAGFRMYFEELVGFSPSTKNKTISDSKIDTSSKTYYQDVTNNISVSIKDLVTDEFSTEKCIHFRSYETYLDFMRFFDSTNAFHEDENPTNSIFIKGCRNQLHQEIKCYKICANTRFFKFNSSVPRVVSLNPIKCGFGRCNNVKNLYHRFKNPIKFELNYTTADIVAGVDRCYDENGSFHGFARNVFDVAAFNEIEKAIVKNVGYKGSVSKNAMIKTVIQERRYNILVKLMRREKLFLGVPIGTKKQLIRKAFSKDNFIKPIREKEQKILQINKLDADHTTFFIGPKVVSLLGTSKVGSGTIVLQANNNPLKAFKGEKAFNLQSFRTPLLNTYIKPPPFEEPKISKLFNQLWSFLSRRKQHFFNIFGRITFIETTQENKSISKSPCYFWIKKYLECRFGLSVAINYEMPVKCSGEQIYDPTIYASSYKINKELKTICFVCFLEPRYYYHLPTEGCEENNIFALKFSRSLRHMDFRLSLFTWLGVLDAYRLMNGKLPFNTKFVIYPILMYDSEIMDNIVMKHEEFFKDVDVFIRANGVSSVTAEPSIIYFSSGICHFILKIIYCKNRNKFCEISEILSRRVFTTLYKLKCWCAAMKKTIIRELRVRMRNMGLEHYLKCFLIKPCPLKKNHNGTSMEFVLESMNYIDCGCCDDECQKHKSGIEVHFYISFFMKRSVRKIENAVVKIVHDSSTEINDEGVVEVKMDHYAYPWHSKKNTDIDVIARKAYFKGIRNFSNAMIAGSPMPLEEVLQRRFRKTILVIGLGLCSMYFADTIAFNVQDQDKYGGVKIVAAIIAGICEKYLISQQNMHYISLDNEYKNLGMDISDVIENHFNLESLKQIISIKKFLDDLKNKNSEILSHSGTELDCSNESFDLYKSTEVSSTNLLNEGVPISYLIQYNSDDGQKYFATINAEEMFSRYHRYLVEAQNIEKSIDTEEVTSTRKNLYLNLLQLKKYRSDILCALCDFFSFDSNELKDHQIPIKSKTKIDFNVLMQFISVYHCLLSWDKICFSKIVNPVCYLKNTITGNTTKINNLAFSNFIKTVQLGVSNIDDRYILNKIKDKRYEVRTPSLKKLMGLTRKGKGTVQEKNQEGHKTNKIGTIKAKPDIQLGRGCGMKWLKIFKKRKDIKSLRKLEKFKIIEDSNILLNLMQDSLSVQNVANQSPLSINALQMEKNKTNFDGFCFYKMNYKYGNYFPPIKYRKSHTLSKHSRCSQTVLGCGNSRGCPSTKCILVVDKISNILATLQRSNLISKSLYNVEYNCRPSYNNSYKLDNDTGSFNLTKTEYLKIAYGDVLKNLIMFCRIYKTRPHITKMDSSFLKKVRKLGSGIYIDGDTGSDIDLIFQHILDHTIRKYNMSMKQSIMKKLTEKELGIDHSPQYLALVKHSLYMEFVIIFQEKLKDILHCYKNINQQTTVQLPELLEANILQKMSIPSFLDSLIAARERAQRLKKTLTSSEKFKKTVENNEECLVHGISSVLSPSNIKLTDLIVTDEPTILKSHKSFKWIFILKFLKAKCDLVLSNFSHSYQFCNWDFLEMCRYIENNGPSNFSTSFGTSKFQTLYYKNYLSMYLAYNYAIARIHFKLSKILHDIDLLFHSSPKFFYTEWDVLLKASLSKPKCPPKFSILLNNEELTERFSKENYSRGITTRFDFGVFLQRNKLAIDRENLIRCHIQRSLERFHKMLCKKHNSIKKIINEIKMIYRKNPICFLHDWIRLMVIALQRCSTLQAGVPQERLKNYFYLKMDDIIFNRRMVTHEWNLYYKYFHDKYRLMLNILKKIKIFFNKSKTNGGETVGNEYESISKSLGIFSSAYRSPLAEFQDVNFRVLRNIMPKTSVNDRSKCKRFSTADSVSLSDTNKRDKSLHFNKRLQENNKCIREKRHNKSILEISRINNFSDKNIIKCISFFFSLAKQYKLILSLIHMLNYNCMKRLTVRTLIEYDNYNPNITYIAEHFFRYLSRKFHSVGYLLHKIVRIRGRKLILPKEWKDNINQNLHLFFAEDMVDEIVRNKADSSILFMVKESDPPDIFSEFSKLLSLTKQLSSKLSKSKKIKYCQKYYNVWKKLEISNIVTTINTVIFKTFSIKKMIRKLIDVKKLLFLPNQILESNESFKFNLYLNDVFIRFSRRIFSYLCFTSKLQQIFFSIMSYVQSKHIKSIPYLKLFHKIKDSSYVMSNVIKELNLRPNVVDFPRLDKVFNSKYSLYFKQKKSHLKDKKNLDCYHYNILSHLKSVEKPIKSIFRFQTKSVIQNNIPNKYFQSARSIFNPWELVKLRRHLLDGKTNIKKTTKIMKESSIFNIRLRALKKEIKQFLSNDQKEANLLKYRNNNITYIHSKTDVIKFMFIHKLGKMPNYNICKTIK